MRVSAATLSTSLAISALPDDFATPLADYNVIERDLRARLEEAFDTAANGQAADESALRMVKEVYEPVVKAVDRRYTVAVRSQ